MQPQTPLKLLLISFVMTLLSLSFTLYFSFSGMKIVEDESEQDIQARMDEQKIYTREEIEIIEREAIRGYEENKRELKSKDVNEIFFNKVKSKSIYFAWIPWLLLPLLIEVERTIRSIILLTMPLAALSVGLIIPIEFVTMCVALFVAIGIKSQSRSIRV